MNPSNTTQELLELEKQFWKGNSKFYQEKLTRDSIMVFPEPVGVLDKEAIVKSIESSQRWNKIDFKNSRITNLSENIVLLVYKAEAVREDESGYKTLASSMYIKNDGEWKLHFHQQTPTNG